MLKLNLNSGNNRLSNTVETSQFELLRINDKKFQSRQRGVNH